MLTSRPAQTPRPLVALRPAQAAARHDSEDGFEIADEGYASDTFSYLSRPASQPPSEVATAGWAVMARPLAQGLGYPAHAQRIPAHRPGASAALTPQQTQRAARHRDLLNYERLLLPTARLGAWHNPSQLQCPLTHQCLTTIAKPVLVRRHHHVSIYDETAFLQWWLEHGTEPVSGRRIALMALYRPQIHPKV